MTDTVIECPKCRFPLQFPRDNCPRCGVVFSKIRDAPIKVPPDKVRLTTGDILEPYDILRPVYFAVSNRGLKSNPLVKLAKKHGINPADLSAQGTCLASLFASEWQVGYQDLPLAFVVCAEELKRQASALGGDAVVWVRQDVDLDTAELQLVYYMQMYGTAVRTKQ